MYQLFSRKNIALASLLIALVSLSGLTHAKKMYKWMDEDGNVYFSDKVSPKDVKHRRESLNGNARVISIIEKEKTKAEKELDKRLVLLRRQQESIINKQKSHDKVLLSTYRNVDDMAVALKGMMLAFDSKRKIVRSNLNRLSVQLLQKQRKAAQFERDGKAIPNNLLADIALSKEQIDKTYVEISNQFQKKKRKREEFEQDMTRFSYLIKLHENEDGKSYLTAKSIAETELGLFICDSTDQCNKAWVSAKQFVRINSAVGVDIETNTLILGNTPYKDSDMSLSVSKMSESDGAQQLFLDIRCRKSSLGDELCRSEKMQKIRHSFSDFIKSTLPEKR